MKKIILLIVLLTGMGVSAHAAQVLAMIDLSNCKPNVNGTVDTAVNMCFFGADVTSGVGGVLDCQQRLIPLDFTRTPTQLVTDIAAAIRAYGASHDPVYSIPANGVTVMNFTKG